MLFFHSIYTSRYVVDGAQSESCMTTDNSTCTPDTSTCTEYFVFCGIFSIFVGWCASSQAFSSLVGSLFFHGRCCLVAALVLFLRFLVPEASVPFAMKGAGGVSHETVFVHVLLCIYMHAYAELCLPMSRLPMSRKGVCIYSGMLMLCNVRRVIT